ncbi:MAG: hypothetical protein AAF823_02350 [Planctomycetota bacterium]
MTSTVSGLDMMVPVAVLLNLAALLLLGVLAAVVSFALLLATGRKRAAMVLMLIAGVLWTLVAFAVMLVLGIKLVSFVGLVGLLIGVGMTGYSGVWLWRRPGAESADVATPGLGGEELRKMQAMDAG